jgi:hypothetical protein
MENQPKAKKIKLFITIEPFNVRFAAAFFPSQSLGVIRDFAKDIMNKMHLKFEPGRVECKKKLAILLPEFTIGDFLEDESEVTVYSQEYGLTLKTLPGDGNDQKLPYFQRTSLLYPGNMLNKKKQRDNEDKNTKGKNENENKKKPKENADKQQVNKEDNEKKNNQDKQKKQKNKNKNKNKNDK